MTNAQSTRSGDRSTIKAGPAKLFHSSPTGSTRLALPRALAAADRVTDPHPDTFQDTCLLPATLSLGLRLFIVSGGPTISAMGLYALSTSMLAGCAPLLIAHGDLFPYLSHYGTSGRLHIAIIPSYFLLCFAALGGWLASRQSSTAASTGVAATPYREPHRSGRLIAAAMLTIGMVGILTENQERLTVNHIYTLSSSALFSGIVLSALVLRRGRKLLTDPLACLALLVQMIYISANLTGYARLLTVSLFAALGILYTLLNPSRWIKCAILAMLPAFVAGLAVIRRFAVDSCRVPTGRATNRS